MFDEFVKRWWLIAIWSSGKAPAFEAESRQFESDYGNQNIKERCIMFESDFSMRQRIVNVLR